MQIDASGTLVLPGGTIGQVIRVLRTGIRVDSVGFATGSSVTTTEIEQYNWFVDGVPGVVVSVTYTEGQVVTAIDGMEDIVTEIERTQSIVYNPEVSGPVAVQDLDNLGLNVSLESANPTAGEVLLSFDAKNRMNIQINLVNIIGSVLSTRRLEVPSGVSAGQLDLSGFPTGMYLVNIQSGNAQKTIRIIKE